MDSTFTLATYMCPSIPVEYYQLLANYLETCLNKKTYLLYDSCHTSPQKDRLDHKRIDLAFIPTTAYLDESSLLNQNFKLLPLGTVNKHPLKGEGLGYYADIILRKDTRESVKEFIDMRGFKWTYANNNSMSGAHQVLLSLKQMGENITFFSSADVAGSHNNAIEMVLAKKADAAVVDSVCLSNFNKVHYAHANDINVLTSWGPLPPHPMIINKSISEDVQQTIVEALLKIHTLPEWKKEFNSFGVVKFEKISEDCYLTTKDMIETTKTLKLGVAYY